MASTLASNAQPLREAALTRTRWVLSCAAAELIGLGTAAGVAVATLAAFGEPTTTSQRLATLAVLGGAGAIEGLALGGLQWRALVRQVPTLPRAWIGVTIAVAVTGWLLGMAGPTFATHEPTAATATEPSLGVILLLAGALGAGAGVLFGAAQWLVLRRHVQRAHRWVWIHAPAWAAAMSVIFLGATLPDARWSPGATLLSGAAGGLGGGLLLGLITSGVATRLEPWVPDTWRLDGKVCAVTGANVGLGWAIADGLAARGAEVVLLCRSASAGEAAARTLTARHPRASVRVVPLDLLDRASVARAGAEVLRRWPTLHVLVHNAGATFSVRTAAADGAEATLTVDALGPWLLTQSLLPALRAARGRVLTLTGVYHRKGRVDVDDLHFARRAYDWLEANNQAQAVRFGATRALADAEPSLFTASIHPGAVLTRAQAHLPAVVRALIATLLRPGFVRAEVGALPVLRLAASPAPLGPSGRFWDRFTLTLDEPTPGAIAAVARGTTG